MAAFASCRRSGWVRVLVVILCALFIFATLGAPPAQALGVESVAVFGLASVLSAATAALGFKLASNEQGQATLQKMVQDFKTVAWATGFVLVGSKLNGLQNGMDYIKMQVKEGKTYLDARVFAWVQQWLAQNGVYDSGSITYPDYSAGSVVDRNILSKSIVLSLFPSESLLLFNNVFQNYNLTDEFLNSNTIQYYYSKLNSSVTVYVFENVSESYNVIKVNDAECVSPYAGYYFQTDGVYCKYSYSYAVNTGYSQNENLGYLNLKLAMTKLLNKYTNDIEYYFMSNYGNVITSANNTGLSGTDTLGKDVIDLTLDQVLQKLKEWAQDWFDAGADSATNAATGAQDLPLTVATGAATANPSIAEDGPLVWFPSFGVPIPTLRSGETDSKTVDQGKENSSAAETSTVDVAENQTVIDSLVNWALNYISPDTGLFSKFPLCVPYDAYLLVTSSLGVGAVDSDSIFGASPGDLDGVVNQDVETYSDFQPIINIKHDFELDGKTYPVELTIDLTPWQPFVTFFREGMALLLIAELIGSEFKRIRGH